MDFRHLVALLVLTATFAGGSGAQESVTPNSSNLGVQAKDGPPRTTAGVKPRSLAQKKGSSASATQQKSTTEQATFGAGCFWHVEHVFEQMKGVNWAVSGYAGGTVPYPSYEMVHEGITGHAEVVMVDFNPDVINYTDLLRAFWKSHDPTSINRQGEDEGPQYRSVIFYHNEEQRRAALKSYQELSARRAYRNPIVTELAPLRSFYRAEDYHQNYYGGKPRSSLRRKTRVTGARKSRTHQDQNAPARANPADVQRAKSGPTPPASQAEKSPPF